ncbi:hypothetical protein [Ornithobacterium rhinotracheale]|uniref:hypothetical protein n=1 Tax=Ornithobacterium rhinotracheale TaxID=28251 RepID=UPI004036E6E4
MKVNYKRVVVKLFHHFKFRFRQTFRVLEANPKLVFTAFLLLFVFILISLSNFYLNLIYALIVGVFHFSRKDIAFLKKVFGNYFYLVVGVGNVLIFIFLSGINVNYEYNLLSVAFVIGLIFFSVLTRRNTPSLVYHFDFVSNDLFELKSYLRRNTLSVFIFSPIFLFLSSRKDLYVFSLLFVMDWILNIFKYNESKEMLGSYFSKHSIAHKIIRYVLILNISLIPSFGIFAFFNFKYFYFIPFYLLIVNLYLILILAKKYANYSHKKAVKYNSIMDYYGSALSAIFIFPAIFQIRQYIKLAKNKISNYVGD